MGYPHFNDLTGQRFGRWEALRCTYRAKRRGEQTRWECRCDCGTVNPSIRYSALMQGNSKSCGCLRRELLKSPDSLRQRHKREYLIWQGMKTRCGNEKHPTYRNYGARGIKVCEEWESSFEAFIQDMGPSPENGSIERVDNMAGYYPGNCKWIDRPLQSRNRRSNIEVEWRGSQRLLTDVARIENVEYHCLYGYWKLDKLPIEKAVEKVKATGNPYRERAAYRKVEEDWV